MLAKTIEGGVFKPIGMTLSDRAYAKLPGFNYHELMTLPIEDLRDFFKNAAHAPTNPSRCCWTKSARA